MTENLESGEVGKLNLVKAIFLPFGFHPRVMWHVIKNYIFQLFWPWIILWLAGAIFFIKDLKNEQNLVNKKRKQLYLCLLLTTYYLLLYYGSWYFHDSINPNSFTLGSSYIRYFLPLFIFNIPLIAYLFAKLWHRKIAYKIFIIFVSCFLFFVSFYQVYFTKHESLTNIKHNLINFQIQFQDLQKHLTSDDLILLDSGTDKIFFPEFKKIIVPQNGVEWPEIHNILPYQPVYYFHHRVDVSTQELNSQKFHPQDLEIYDRIEIDGGGALYKLSIIK